jgi:hypothetical protein
MSVSSGMFTIYRLKLIPSERHSITELHLNPLYYKLMSSKLYYSLFIS